jgi:RimJ/RimL family protein N-acetyltransferase
MSLPILETPRLLLRAPELCDLDRWAEVMANEESARYIGGIQTRSMVWRSMMAMRGAGRLAHGAPPDTSIYIKIVILLNVH